MKLTIIGGGASAALLTIQLLLQCREGLHICILEKKPRIGYGIAYDNDDNTYLLNVPVMNMSIYSDDPNHFYNWLKENNYPATLYSFMPRKVFGDYINNTLKTVIKKTKAVVEHIAAEAVRIEIRANSASVFMDNGQQIVTEKLVLATGNNLPADIDVIKQSNITGKKYFGNPWDKSLYNSLNGNENILIIGSGLTMADIVLVLNKRGHKGTIYSVSTHGHLPLAHTDFKKKYPSFYEEIKDIKTALGLLKVVRKHVELATLNGQNARTVIDSLRPFTQNIWMNLPDSEKKVFFTHLSHFWNIVRHRISADNIAQLEQMIAQQKLILNKGRILSIKEKDDALSIQYRPSKNSPIETIQADIVVNCTGPVSDYTKVDIQLIKQLLEAGFIQKDPLALGLMATKDGAIIGKDAQVSSILYAIGPPMKGILWEITAIPDIRLQAAKLANLLLESVNAKKAPVYPGFSA